MPSMVLDARDGGADVINVALAFLKFRLQCGIGSHECASESSGLTWNGGLKISMPRPHSRPTESEYIFLKLPSDSNMQEEKRK